MVEVEHPLLLLGTASTPLPAAPSAAAAWPLPFAPGTAVLQAAGSGTGYIRHIRQLPAEGLCWLAVGRGDGGSRDRGFLTLREMRRNESGIWGGPNQWQGLGQDGSPPCGAFPPGCVPRDWRMRGWGGTGFQRGFGDTNPSACVWEQLKTTQGISHPDGGAHGKKLLENLDWGVLGSG